MDCIFCKIINGEIPTEKVYEDEENVGFLDANPISPGHTVVIPKVHVAKITDMNDERVSTLFNAVKRTAGHVEKGIGAEGLNIGINHGEKAGQAIPHIHVHIIPRFEGDKGGSVHMIVRNPPQEDLSTIAGKIGKIQGSVPEKEEEVTKEEPEEETESEEEVDKDEKNDSDEELEEIRRKMQTG